jgi:chromate transporter
VQRVPLSTVAREWGRIGVTGFGGPPTHIAMLRRLVVGRRAWMPAREFEDAVAACNLLPGPASTQLAIFCARRVAGAPGAVVGGLSFIVPAVVLILVLSLLFLGSAPPVWVRGAGAGAGAAVAAVAVHAAVGLLGTSWARARERRRWRWIAYLTFGAVAGALLGPYLVLVLIACGLAELVARHSGSSDRLGAVFPWPAPVLLATVSAGGVGALAWVAFKVGALSYGGGFVIIPLMQHDAVHTYHWMTAGQFLSAVALGQVTPGPVVQTVAVVGYAAAGVAGGLLAALVAFAPSFLFVLGGGRYFDRLRASAAVQAFLTGAGPAAIGAIAGAAVPLALALAHRWQFGVLALAAIWLLGVRRGVVSAIVGAAGLGLLAFAAGAPVG